MNLTQLRRELLEHPDLATLSADEQFALLMERSRHVVGEQRLHERLQECSRDHRPMRVKYGIDATGRQLHLGHAVPLFVLRRLQNMGHEVTILIGDFTARVGDPSGRVSTRPILTTEEISQNASRFTDQIAKILDVKRIKIRFNNEWLQSFPLADFLRIAGGLSVSTALQREDFRNRKSITRAEMLYSMLMGIDSVKLNAELELGGDDQLLNFYDGERIMQNEGMDPQSAITTDILMGTTGDGKKMSKSFDNYIALEETPEEMYGKFMSIPDTQLEQYFKCLTDLRDQQWLELEEGMKAGELHPMEVKRLLASTVVEDLLGADAAVNAEQDFNQRVVQKDVPELELIRIPKAASLSWIGILRQFSLPQVKSNSDARRLLEGNGVHRIDGETETALRLDQPVPDVGAETILRIGKRSFVKFTLTAPDA